MNIILDDEETYTIFLQRLDDSEVATKRDLIVLDRLPGKEIGRNGPDELVEHPAQASVCRTTRTGRVPKASQKVPENDCFADVAIKKDAVAASKAAKQRRSWRKAQGGA